MMNYLKRLIVLVFIAASAFVMLPAAPASADLCNPGEIWCMPDAEIQLDDPDHCDDNIAVTTLINMSLVATCTTASDVNPSDWWKGPSTDNGIPVVGDLFARMTQLLQFDAMRMLDFILLYQLSGDSTDLSPILSCDNAQGVQKENCLGKTEWFLGQFSLMRMVGFYVVVPLYLIMVIQSIVKGSLYNLLRHSLIMLPLSVIGTAVIVVFMQMFLNITDDMSNYIVNRATTGLEVDTCTGADGQQMTSPACGFRNSLAERSIGSSGAFVAFIWLIVLMAASVAIYLELLGRQMGIYFMTLMMPLVMAGMVWPRTIGIAKKLFQYELALIISKLFIVAAISLGMGAVANSGNSTCTQTSMESVTLCGGDSNDVQNGQDVVASNSSPFQALAAGTLIMLLAAFAGAKVVTLSPAAMAGQQPVWNKGAIASRGQVMAVIGQRAIQFMDFVNRNRKPRGVYNPGMGGADGRLDRDSDGGGFGGSGGQGSGDGSSGDGSGEGTRGDGSGVPPPPPPPPGGSGRSGDGSDSRSSATPPPPPPRETTSSGKPTYKDPETGRVIQPARPFEPGEGTVYKHETKANGDFDQLASPPVERYAEGYMAAWATEHQRRGIAPDVYEIDSVGGDADRGVQGTPVPDSSRFWRFENGHAYNVSNTPSAQRHLAERRGQGPNVNPQPSAPPPLPPPSTPIIPPKPPGT